MKILEAELKNFGNFVDEKLSFHDGINVVWAKNGAGKSTIHEFILAMFYGLKGEECIRWQSWNGNGCLSGKLRFESGKLLKYSAKYDIVSCTQSDADAVPR